MIQRRRDPFGIVHLWVPRSHRHYNYGKRCEDPYDKTHIAGHAMLSVYDTRDATTCIVCIGRAGMVMG